MLFKYVHQFGTGVFICLQEITIRHSIRLSSLMHTIYVFICINNDSLRKTFLFVVEYGMRCARRTIVLTQIIARRKIKFELLITKTNYCWFFLLLLLLLSHLLSLSDVTPQMLKKSAVPFKHKYVLFIRILCRL